MIRLLLVVMMLLVGCQAGTSYELLGYDAIELATVEARKGVIAYDAAVRANGVRLERELLTRLKATIIEAALADGQEPADAESYAEAIVFAGTPEGLVPVRQHLTNLREQERRRQVLLEVTLDNLDYAADVAKLAKEFALYQSDISAQWKAYLMAQSRARLAKMPEEPPNVQEARPEP